jgi:hypothetical protein
MITLDYLKSIIARLSGEDIEIILETHDVYHAVEHIPSSIRLEGRKDGKPIRVIISTLDYK